MSSAPVVVLGGTGFVGRAIVARLAARGMPVRVLTRWREHGRGLWVLPGVDILEANLSQGAGLAHHFQGARVVINLVGILNEKNRGDFDRVHAELPLRVAKACLSAGVSRLLHMSALNADSAAPSRYLRSKGEGEEHVLNAGRHGLRVTVFRPSVIFGAEDSFLNLFARLVALVPVLPLAKPNARFQPVYVGDVAEAFVKALDLPACVDKRYDLCGPEAFSLRELVAWVARQSGHRRWIIGLSDTLAQLQALVMEKLPNPPMTRDNLASMAVDSICACPFPADFGLTPISLEAVADRYPWHHPGSS